MSIEYPQLFETERETCRFPMVEGATGYRYGCRCSRCSDAHQVGYRQTSCIEPDCDEPRVKHRRTCAMHTPPPEERRVVQTAHCELCGRSYSWYESQLVQVRSEIADLYRRVCSGCRQRYIGVIKTHRLDTERAIQLILAENCDLCDSRFSIAANGRRNVHVDHDHFCCPGGASCGNCIRGFLCPRCNHVIASVESVRDVGVERALAYLQRFEPASPDRDADAYGF